MYTRTDRVITLIPTKSPLNYELRDFPSFPGVSSRCTFCSSQGVPKGDGLVKLVVETQTKRCSILLRGLFPDIVCFICGWPGRWGCLGPRPCRKRGVCALRGKHSRNRFSCVPMMNIGTRPAESSGHIFCSCLLQKRSHLIRSRSVRPKRRSGRSAAACTTSWPRRLLGFGVPCWHNLRVPSLVCQVNSNLTF